MAPSSETPRAPASSSVSSDARSAGNSSPPRTLPGKGQVAADDLRWKGSIVTPRRRRSRRRLGGAGSPSAQTGTQVVIERTGKEPQAQGGVLWAGSAPTRTADSNASGAASGGQAAKRQGGQPAEPGCDRHALEDASLSEEAGHTLTERRAEQQEAAGHAQARDSRIARPAVVLAQGGGECACQACDGDAREDRDRTQVVQTA